MACVEIWAALHAEKSFKADPARISLSTCPQQPCNGRVLDVLFNRQGWWSQHCGSRKDNAPARAEGGHLRVRTRLSLPMAVHDDAMSWRFSLQEANPAWPEGTECCICKPMVPYRASQAKIRDAG